MPDEESSQGHATAWSYPTMKASGVTSKPASRGHLKTGQLSASRTTCFYPTCDRSGKFFLEVRILFTRAARFILTSPGRRVRPRRDATGAPTQRPEWRGGRQPPQKNEPFWRES